VSAGVYEDNANRWEESPDGSWTPLPKQKMPTTRTAQPGAYVGEVRMFVTSALPAGWLVCDGTELPPGYPDLEALLPGWGPNGERFLPNLNDRVPMGGGSLLDEGGTNSHTLSVANLPSHSHGAGTLVAAMSGAHTHGVIRAGSTGSSDNGSVRSNVDGAIPDGATRSDGAHNHSVTGSTTSVGSGAPLDTTPAHVRLVFAIYAGGS
jgi:microcystin-dependent protein